MINPYGVTKDLESALSEYTGAPYVVCVSSCSAALQLCCEAVGGYPKTITIPSRTYCSVPMSIIHAGHKVRFEDIYWRGAYQLKPLQVWDSARRFTSGMYVKNQFQCVSFSTTKILGIEQGGAILHDNPEADKWFRKMRFDGREEGVNPKDQNFDVIGHHMIMLPSIAAQLLLKLYHLPRINEDLPDFDYPDLSKFEVFK